ncbi:uncharacterized protein RSE6_09136 [Rhynchosporium secalis]|uniref:Uncharacterized protein n=1 Tax=Rhynchosporium secalis TaxID=38038 RepID=A0A1E1MHB8_RHYSE|nr:uncharacterized protein RSE6_09136 [Rhynchosporium secalis]
MGKSEGYTPEEACPSIYHEISNFQPADGNSKNSRAAANSNKSQRSDLSRFDASYDSTGHLEPTETRKPRPASKSRKSGDTIIEEGCHDSDHESSLNVESHKVTKLKHLKLRSDDAYSVEESCQHSDHDAFLPPQRIPLPKSPLESPSGSGECLPLDHDQPTRGQSSLAAATKLVDGKSPQTDTSSRNVKQSSKKVENRVENLRRRSSLNQCCFDSDNEKPPGNSKKAKKAKKKADRKIRKDLEEINKKAKKEAQKQNQNERKRIKRQEKQKKKEIEKRGNQDKKEREEIDKQEKKDKRVTILTYTIPGDNHGTDTDQWLSPSDAKKVRKLISSRDEKIRKSQEKLKTVIDRMKQRKESEISKVKGKNKSTYLEEHRLSTCDVIQTNDGPSDFGGHDRTPAQAFPRGIQIMAKNTNTLEGGFPYPKELAQFGISKGDWSVFCLKLTEPLANWKIAYAIEKILDICAEEDVTFFRPKGFILRLDMPGEEQYGLDMMDIYHTKLGSIHTDNFTAIPRGSKVEGYGGAIKHKHHVPERSKDRKHLESLRDKAFRSTRLMIDPIIALKDPELATQRGWAGWIIASKKAQKLAAEAPPKRMDNKPWYGYFPARWDRWPPSKHLYYDRFRGAFHPTGTKKNPNSCFIPDYDSMDQRGSPYTSSVIPCDEVEFAVLHPDQP